MLREVVIGLLSVTTIVGIIAFFIRQGIWTRYIQPLVSRKPKYSLLFDNGHIRASAMLRKLDGFGERALRASQSNSRA